ncbi:general secretion pathway protein GspK [Marichromatium gracile]|uniref:general secretion pathway protein GspK n=1 Tax=Marichromatium gracile TaxID=1048 RepID=UPI001F2616D4|nr:type II secretion system protein GspK [Marichromatium gracile]MCF1182406.1 general secretion pathway protein GspK [Marichromatium gracile]
MSAPRQRGVALLLVLWVLALLTVMAAGLTATGRSELALVDNALAAARFRAAADAALAEVALRLTLPPGRLDGPVWRGDARPHPWSFGGERLEVRIQDLGGLIDLNRADPARLADLLRVLGVEPGRAERLAAVIVDWRDGDALTRVGGAEDADYRALGRPFGARDGDLPLVDELALLPGMTPELAAALAPLTRVTGDAGGIVRAFAPAAVLAALDGIGLEQAQALRAAREIDPRLRGGPRYRIEVRARDGGWRLLALLELGADPGRPYRVRWRRLVYPGA